METKARRFAFFCSRGARGPRPIVRRTAAETAVFRPVGWGKEGIMKTQDPKKRAILESFKNGLIVSCQVQWDDPIYTDDQVTDFVKQALTERAQLLAHCNGDAAAAQYIRCCRRAS